MGSESDDDDYMCGWKRALKRRQQAAAAREAQAVLNRLLTCKRKNWPIPPGGPMQPPLQQHGASWQANQPLSCGVDGAESPSKLLRRC